MIKGKIMRTLSIGLPTVDRGARAGHDGRMSSVQTLKSHLQSLMPEAVEMLRRMVEINSFTSNPAGVNRLSRLTADCFAPLGFTPEFVPSSNPAWGAHLVLRKEGRTSRNLALISHLDTVFPPEEEERNGFKWSVEGDRIFGPGTHDIKGGTVMMWLVLCALRHRAPEIYEAMTWNLLWNSSEECFSPDFGEVCRRRFNKETLAALVFEAEGRSESASLLVVARKGRGTWRATVSGRGSHAGGKHEHGANAAVQLGRTVQQIAALTDYQRGLTVNVGTIAGGTVLNRIPHAASAEGEFRAFTAEAYNQGKTGLLALAGKGEVKSPDDGFTCEVKMEILSESRPWLRNPATDKLFRLWLEAAAELGLRIEPQERGGLSDGNLIWDQVPTLDGLGPWGDNDHCSERTADGCKLPEFVELSSFVPKAALNVVAIEKLARS